MRYDQIRKGDILIADNGFTCLPAGEYPVKRHVTQGYYVECPHHQHFLDGRLYGGSNDDIAGFRIKLRSLDQLRA